MGSAWNLNNSKTVIRSGYGIYYARYPRAMINSLFSTNNLYQQTLSVQTSNAAQVPLGPVFPNVLSTAPNVEAGLGRVGADAFSRLLINNWQLSAITTIATGQPLTETLNVSSPLSTAQVAALGLPSNVSFTSTTLNGFGGSTQVPFLGVNTLRLPHTYRVDARLSKILPITARFTATLQFEVFNLTNTITYTNLFTRGYNANGLNISPASGLGTPTAWAGFPDGTNARRAQASIRLEL